MSRRQLKRSRRLASRSGSSLAIKLRQQSILATPVGCSTLKWSSMSLIHQTQMRSGRSCKKSNWKRQKVAKVNHKARNKSKKKKHWSSPERPWLRYRIRRISRRLFCQSQIGWMLLSPVASRQSKKAMLCKWSAKGSQRRWLLPSAMVQMTSQWSWKLT